MEGTLKIFAPNGYEVRSLSLICGISEEMKIEEGHFLSFRAVLTLLTSDQKKLYERHGPLISLPHPSAGGTITIDRVHGTVTVSIQGDVDGVRDLITRAKRVLGYTPVVGPIGGLWDWLRTLFRRARILAREQEGS